IQGPRDWSPIPPTFWYTKQRCRSDPTRRKNCPLPGRTTEMDLFERLRPPSATEEAQKPLPDLKLQSALILLDWRIQRWDNDVVWMRDIRQFAPSAVRNPETALAAAEVLIKDGWLVAEPTHQYNAHKWRFVRRPVVRPLVTNE